jgi:hypothetical protein
MISKGQGETEVSVPLGWWIPEAALLQKPGGRNVSHPRTITGTTRLSPPPSGFPGFPFRFPAVPLPRGMKDRDAQAKEHSSPWFTAGDYD